jgi:hypothetical protein
LPLLAAIICCKAKAWTDETEELAALKVVRVMRSDPFTGTAVTTVQQMMQRMAALTGTPAKRCYMERKRASNR